MVITLEKEICLIYLQWVAEMLETSEEHLHAGGWRAGVPGYLDRAIGRSESEQLPQAAWIVESQLLWR